MNPTRSPRILLVEDDADDLFLSRRVLLKAGIPEVFHVTDGQSAVDYLSGNGSFGNRSVHPLPDVLLVDLKIPEISGHQLLEWIQSKPELAHLRSYVLSSSGEERDRHRAAAAGARGFFVKPLTAEDIRKLR